MGWIDKEGSNDGITAKGEIKVNILNNLSYLGYNIDTTEIEALIDNYAGEDGIFTPEEYTSMKNDNTYKNFLDKYNISALPIKGTETMGDEIPEVRDTSDEGFIKQFLNKIYNGIMNFFKPQNT